MLYLLTVIVLLAVPSVVHAQNNKSDQIQESAQIVKSLECPAKNVFVEDPLDTRAWIPAVEICAPRVTAERFALSIMLKMQTTQRWGEDELSAHLPQAIQWIRTSVPAAEKEWLVFHFRIPDLGTKRDEELLANVGVGAFHKELRAEENDLPALFLELSLGARESIASILIYYGGGMRIYPQNDPFLVKIFQELLAEELNKSRGLPAIWW